MLKKDKIVINSNSKKSNGTVKDHTKYDKDQVKVNIRRPKTAQEKKDMLISDYSEVVVHDFCDEYHMSDEEKKEIFTYYEVYKKLRQCKRKYRKVGEYVKVMRICLDALDIVSKNNGVYAPELFKEKVVKGEIEVNGLNFPKYVGKDRNSLNWKYISRYITDVYLDYTELDKKKTNISTIFDIDYEDEDEVDELTLKQYGTTYEEYFNTDEDFKSNIKEFRKQELENIIKAMPVFQEAAKNLKKKSRTGSIHSYIYQVSQNDFDYIRELDEKLGVANTIPKFKGNIMDDDDYFKYLNKLKEWEEDHIRVSYKGRVKTVEEAKELDTKSLLEESGWNIRSLYKANTKAEEKARKKETKRDKKEEKILKKKLSKLQSKRNERDDDSLVNSKKKKKKKKDKKNKKGDD